MNNVPNEQKQHNKTTNIVWVALHDNQQNVKKYVKFDVLPVIGIDNYHCIPERTLSYESAIELAQQLTQGSVHGYVQGYRWYRQVKAPDNEIDYK
jgi:hypothetical protein